MAATGTKTDAVFTSVHRDLQARLTRVREELAPLAREERELTQALSRLERIDSPATSATPVKGKGSKAHTLGTPPRKSRSSSARKATASRRPRRSASKSTPERLKELQGVLADGPMSRAELAAALKVSPARVQQLLAELGGTVSSQVDPGKRAKLWGLKRTASRQGAAKATQKRGRVKRSPAAATSSPAAK